MESQGVHSVHHSLKVSGRSGRTGRLSTMFKVHNDTGVSVPLLSNCFQFIIPSLYLVTLLQKYIVWGRGDNAVTSSESRQSKPFSSSKPVATTKDQNMRGRPRKPSTAEDWALVAALRSGKTFERNERQSNDLEKLKAGACNYTLQTFFMTIVCVCWPLFSPLT